MPVMQDRLFKYTLCKVSKFKWGRVGLPGGIGATIGQLSLVATAKVHDTKFFLANFELPKGVKV